MSSTGTLDLLADVDAETASSNNNSEKRMKKINARSGTFTDNMKLPIHRWFRYSAGFSADWVDVVVREYQNNGELIVLDPFAGSGTTVIAAQQAGAKAIGFESHPFVSRIAQAKLLWPTLDLEDTRKIADKLLVAAGKLEASIPSTAAPLLTKCYTDEALSRLFALRDALAAEQNASDDIKSFLWLAITAILRPCSHVGTAQWQYVLPNRSKSRVLDPYLALEAKLDEMLEDIELARTGDLSSYAEVSMHDARAESDLPDDSVDLVVTSPPYPNNYDYADATRLEMSFWGEINSWGDLQEAVRQYIIRSCSQHSAAEKLQLDELLEASELRPIIDELAPVCRELEEVRLTRGGRKTYHTMVAAYFIDLANVFSQLRRVCKPGSTLCFVIGDSAPYGVHVPAERWLGDLAVSAGFQNYHFEKLRDRNIKWKNRKHRVPLHEGRLWIKG